MCTCINKRHSRGLPDGVGKGLGKIKIATSPLIREAWIVRYRLQCRYTKVAFDTLEVLIFLAGDLLYCALFLASFGPNEENVVIVSIDVQSLDDGSVHLFQYILHLVHVCA